MTNPFKNLMFQDALPLPNETENTLVDATRGGNLELEIIPARFRPHSMIPKPEQDNCWATVIAGTADPGSLLNSYIGPLIVAMHNKPLSIRWRNKTAPKNQFYPPPIDVIGPSRLRGLKSGHSQPPKGLNMHLKGAKLFGPTNGWSYTEAPAQSTQISYYPNTQAANLLWYHDHSLQQTAQNVYAGIIGTYIVRDNFDNALLEQIKPENEIPLILQDKQLWDPDADNGNGCLTSRMRYEINTEPQTLNPFTSLRTRRVPYGISGHIAVYPEFFGEFNVVNGKLWPKLALPSRDLYRFRILNACNARTYAIKVMVETNGKWQFANDLMIVIGTDGGFLGEAIPLSSDDALVIAPGERRDLILDLRKLNIKQIEGISRLYLVNIATVPFSSNANSIASSKNNLSLGLTPESICGSATSVADVDYHPQIQGFPQIMCLEVDVSIPAYEHKSFLDTKLPNLLLQARASVAEFKYRNALGWKPRTGIDFGPNRVFLIDNQLQIKNDVQADEQNLATMHLRRCRRVAHPYDADLLLYWDVDTHEILANPKEAKESTTIIPYRFDQVNQGKPEIDDYASKPDSYERWYFINLQANTGPSSDRMGVLPNLDMRPMHIHLVNFYEARLWSIGPDSKRVNLISDPGLYSKLALRDTIRVAGNQIVELIVYFPPGYTLLAENWNATSKHCHFHCHILEHQDMGMLEQFEYKL